MTLDKNIFDLKNLGNLFILEDKKSVAVLDFVSGIAQLKSKLLQHKIGPGHKVILCLGNTKLFCEYLFAIWEVGACAVPISPHSTKHELDHVAKSVNPSLIVYSDNREEFLTSTSFTHPENILILHTSGSSGKPKGVMISREALQQKMQTYHQNLPYQNLSKTLCMLPLNFGHGLISNFLFPLLNGNEVILAPSGNMDIYSSLGQIIDDFGITCFSSVPSILKIASNFSERPTKKSLQKIFCASAPLNQATWQQTLEWSSGVRADNMYGMTEIASWVAGDQKESAESYEENAFDYPWGAEINIVKENPADEYGEIFLKSNSMMTGYYNDSVNTNKVLHDGWFKTGDMGLISNDRLLLKGRLDNVINVGGLKIYPEEINQLVRKHSKVFDCFALGLRSSEKEADHGIGCILIGKEGQVLDISEIQDMCKQHLSSYKIPSQFKIMDKIPVNERGKFDIVAIRRLFQERGRGV